MHTVTHEDAGIAQYYVHETGAGYSSPRGVKQCDRYDSAEGRPTHAHKLDGRGDPHMHTSLLEEEASPAWWERTDYLVTAVAKNHLWGSREAGESTDCSSK